MGYDESSKNSRKSPMEPARTFGLGHQKRGVDGNEWKVVSTRNGSLRWQKTTQNHVSSQIGLNDYRMIVSGDIHGDPIALVRILQMSRVIREPKEGWDGLVSSIESFTEPDILNERILDHLQWNRNYHPTTIVFAGDLLDTRRMGPPNIPIGSEECIMRTLIRLKYEDSPHDIQWVLGNHDVQNTQSDTKLFCNSYTHQHYCDENGFTETRRDWVRESILKMDAKVILVLNDIVICHGGLESTFLDKYNEKSSIKLVESINNDYLNLVREKSIDEETIMRLHDERSPIWFRPSVSDESVIKRVGAIAGVVGHTIQTHINVVRSKRDSNKFKVSTSPNGEDIQKGSLYFTDIGMSRAFDEPRPKLYTCLIIWNDRVRSEEFMKK